MIFHSDAGVRDSRVGCPELTGQFPALHDCEQVIAMQQIDIDVDKKTLSTPEKLINKIELHVRGCATQALVSTPSYFFDADICSQGAKGFLLFLRTGASSGKCRSNTSFMP